MGHSLELSRHDICLFMGFRPSNIPGPNESRWRIFFRRLELMFWTVVGPEMIITWALQQWLGARYLEKEYKGELSSIIHSIYSQILNRKNSDG